MAGQQTGGSLKSMKEKSGQAEKEAQENSGLKTAGPEGEITAGLYANFVFICDCIYHFLGGIFLFYACWEWHFAEIAFVGS